MNIIELARQIVNNYPEISDFSGNIHIDYTTNENGNFGIYSVNDNLVKRTITGGEYRQNEFILYATNQSINDYDRLQNSTFLIRFGYWLEQQKGLTFDVVVGFEPDGTPKTKTGTVTRIKTANGMLFSVPTGDINDGCTYQIQMFIDYKID